MMYFRSSFPLKPHVAPYTAAWIEMRSVVLPFSVISVAPFAGAWIEISEK